MASLTTCPQLRESLGFQVEGGEGDPDQKLHRAFITPMGRQLSQYKTLQEFGKALLAIVKGQSHTALDSADVMLTISYRA